MAGSAYCPMDINHELASAASPSYVPTQPYDDKRGFEPERIFIPPPAVDFNDGKPAFHVTEIEPFDHGNKDFGNPSFLRSLRTLHKLELNHSMLSWKYEHRRQAQPILPFLLLGSSSVAQSSEFLQQTRITSMLSVRNGLAAKRMPKYLHPASFISAKGLETATFDLDSSYECIRNLRPVIKAMNDHLERNCIRQPISSLDDVKGKILVFCETGNERSPVIVSAYLMVVYGVDAITAIQIVQSQRFCVNIEDSMKGMLQNFETILIAERQVAAAERGQEQARSQNIPQTQVLNKPGKRTLDTAYESDEEMEGGIEWSGANQSNRRPGVAPFADSGV